MNRTLAKAGVVASAFGVFIGGWLAMRTDDWKQIVLFSALALGAGYLASAFSRRAR
jgi:NADH:ubiquinone oxidoreductase subunit 4 (subunit M)